MDDWQTRETLLIRVRKIHNDDAWDEFYLYYKTYIYMIIHRMGVSHHDAEEITQQVLLSLWKKMPEFDYDSAKGRFRGYLCTITSNAVKNFYVAANRKRSKMELLAVDNPNLAASLSDIERIAEEEWQIYVANLAWEKIEPDLAPKVKEAFLLLTDGIEPKEVSLKLEVELNTIYVYRKRVKAQLCKEIARLDSELC